MDMNYACKYFKQFMFETHMNFRFNELVKLEECFFMFHRHTRFYINNLLDTPTGLKSEFQQTNFSLNLSMFKDELYLAEYMFVNGEFYFVNKNFFFRIVFWTNFRLKTKLSCAKHDYKFLFKYFRDHSFLFYIFVFFYQ